MKSIVKGRGLLAGAALLLSACGGFEGQRVAAQGPATPATGAPVSDVPVITGDPFKVGDTLYTPTEIADYDDVGYAGQYDASVAGQPTANGERFDPAAISAAHKTLPLPSYVEVTALDTGRTILVRVNDRGPMVNDRLIDLSPGAAQQLGLTDGVAAVRVRRTNPPAAERLQLRNGQAARERIVTPVSLLAILRTRIKDMPAPRGAPAAAVAPATPAAPSAGPVAVAGTKPGADRPIVAGPATAMPPPAAKPEATPVKGRYAVQVGAFSSEARAAAAARTVDGAVSKAGNFWRVRVGPFASDAAAREALTAAKAKGFRDAMVVRD